jgi:hypothetical protein
VHEEPHLDHGKKIPEGSTILPLGHNFATFPWYARDRQKEKLSFASSHLVVLASFLRDEYNLRE